MKALLVTLVVASTLLLAGCPATMPLKTEVVVVDKPMPFIPPPPVVPKYDYKVDKLTPEDAKDPGKVGQAYKYDMTALRQLVLIYDSILEQYQSASQNFDEVNKQIDELFKKVTPPVK
jgi:hypothetical protein